MGFLFPFPIYLQVVRRHILGSIVQSERSYVESLKRILQVGDPLFGGIVEVLKDLGDADVLLFIVGLQEPADGDGAQSAERQEMPGGVFPPEGDSAVPLHVPDRPLLPCG